MNEIMKNKDGARALFCGAAMQLFLGILYVWSVFVVPVSKYFSWEVSAVKLTSSFMLCFFVIGILAAGRIITKLDSSRLVLAGGLLLALGMAISAFVPQEMGYLIYISYGCVGGFGVGMAYNAIITNAQRHFPQKRGLATGISVCAFGFSTVIFAPLIEVLVASNGLRNTLLILAAVFVVSTLALFRFIVMPKAAPAKATGSKAAAAPTAARQFTTAEMLKTPDFYLIAFSMMFLLATFFILNPSLKSLAVDKGLSQAMGVFTVMVTGVANALGRLAVPLMSDKVGRENTTLGIILATSVSALLLCVVSGALFIIVIAVIAFCYGGSSGIYPVLTSDRFGVANVGSNYGMVMVGFMLSSFVFPVFFGAIDNMTAKFIAMSIVALVGAALIFILKRRGTAA